VECGSLLPLSLCRSLLRPGFFPDRLARQFDGHLGRF
jgi:hypothetical protein